MSAERRYRDDEVQEIFGLAARHETTAPSEPEGLTLAAIQEIGRDVGLDPAVIAHAAATVDARGASLPARTSLGMPVQVGRVVPLPRPLTDREWEMLVAELRTTFGARGRVASEGGLREWSNGNLHACVEPTGTGYRLRLGTRKGDAGALNALGAGGLLAGAVSFGSLLLSGELPGALMVPAMIAAAGLSAFAANLVRLPRWARQREDQMAEIAATVAQIMDPPASGPGAG